MCPHLFPPCHSAGAWGAQAVVGWAGMLQSGVRTQPGWHMSPTSRTCPQQHELQASQSSRAASHSLLAGDPLSPCGHIPEGAEGLTPWDIHSWPGSRGDLWLSHWDLRHPKSSQLSPDNLHWPDPASGSRPGTSQARGPSEQTARTVSWAQCGSSPSLVLAPWGHGSSSTPSTGLQAPPTLSHHVL